MYAGVFGLLIHKGFLNSTPLDGLAFGIASVCRGCFFMPAMGNGLLATKTPNPILSCALVLMMHSIFDLSLGIGFSILLN